MTVAEWDRVKELFDATLLLPEGERDAFLKFAAETPTIMDEVHSLLSVYEASPEFLEDAGPILPATVPAEWTDSPLEGRRIGAWQLVREIGRGGMGTVWEANRADGQYQQRAAVKLLSTSLLSRADILRFLDERQILASLEHPGIARLLDGGALDDGSPYLVMEYIEGSPLDLWSETRAGSLRERLEVFLSTAQRSSTPTAAW